MNTLNATAAPLPAAPARAPYLGPENIQRAVRRHWADAAQGPAWRMR
jgi:hypothetical protein